MGRPIRRQAEQHAADDLVVSRRHRHVLAGGSNVAQAAFQWAAGVDRTAATGLIHQVDREGGGGDGVDARQSRDRQLAGVGSAAAQDVIPDAAGGIVESRAPTAAPPRRARH